VTGYGPATYLTDRAGAVVRDRGPVVPRSNEYYHCAPAEGNSRQPPAVGRTPPARSAGARLAAFQRRRPPDPHQQCCGRPDRVRSRIREGRWAKTTAFAVEMHCKCRKVEKGRCFPTLRQEKGEGWGTRPFKLRTSFRRERPKIAQDSVRHGGRNPGEPFQPESPAPSGRNDIRSDLHRRSCNCPGISSHTPACHRN